MALTGRQKRLYKDTVNIYKPVTQGYDPVTRAAYDIIYPATPTYSGVKCYVFTARDSSLPQIIGRNPQDNLFTYEEIDFEASQDVDDAYAIVLTTSGHPEQNEWFVAQGGPQSRPTRKGRNINLKRILARKSIKPAGVR